MDNRKKALYQRKNYFIDKEFQSKFILKFCAVVALGGVATIALLYLFSKQTSTVAFVDSRVVVRSTADFLLPLLLQTVLVVTVIVSLATIAVTLFVSHKLAGPLYRFRKVLQALEEGNFASGFMIRKEDQLQDLALAFNAMIQRIGQELKELSVGFKFLRDKLDNISEHEVVEHKRLYLSELKKLAGEINKLMQFFKL